MKFFVLLCLFFTSTLAWADYRENPRAADLLRVLKADYGFTADDLNAVNTALGEAARIPALVESETKNKEKTLTWTRYQPIHVSEKNAARGARFLAENRKDLARAEKIYGVPPKVIAAIMGVETKYGAYSTPHRVLDALATQGFEHPTRSPFFFAELTEFFVLCKEMGFKPTEVRGSYAGAMGYAQFMPSNYRKLAVDFDGDGKRDLWSNADAIGSIANYLVNYRPADGYQRGSPMMTRAKLSKGMPKDILLNQTKPTYTYGQLRKLGINSKTDLPASESVGLIELQLDDGKEYWLGMHNFYAIMTYNPRTFYAMAVAQLAEAIQRAR